MKRTHTLSLECGIDIVICFSFKYTLKLSKRTTVEMNALLQVFHCKKLLITTSGASQVKSENGPITQGQGETKKAGHYRLINYSF